MHKTVLKILVESQIGIGFGAATASCCNRSRLSNLQMVVEIKLCENWSNPFVPFNHLSTAEKQLQRAI